MWHCGEHFSHIIMDEKKQEHQLVTTGIYRSVVMLLTKYMCCCCFTVSLYMFGLFFHFRSSHHVLFTFLFDG